MRVTDLLLTPGGLLVAALLLDTLIGDPWGRLHPVRGIGVLAAFAEDRLRRFRALSPVFAGAVAWVIVVGVTAALSSIVLMASRALAAATGGWVAGVIIVYLSIAPRDLARHAHRVAVALRRDDLGGAREAVSMIVGRDVDGLDSDAVGRAAVESVAESFVDGVAAPIFFALVFGPVGAASYRAINTLDSMFGHRDDRYLEFGRLSARADDWAGLIPARLAGPVISLASVLLGLNGIRAFRVFLRDRLRHASPNAGHPEASFAGALGLRLGGPISYDGVTVDKAWIGDGSVPCSAADVDAAIRLMYVSTIVLIAAAVGVQLLIT